MLSVYNHGIHGVRAYLITQIIRIISTGPVYSTKYIRIYFDNRKLDIKKNYVTNQLSL